MLDFIYAIILLNSTLAIMCGIAFFIYTVMCLWKLTKSDIFSIMHEWL